MSEHSVEPLIDGGVDEPPSTPLARIVSLFGEFGVAVLVVPIVLTCADIIWRRAVGGAFVDTFDITKLCLVTAAAFTIPYGFIHGSHVTVDLLVEQFSHRSRHAVDALIHLTSAVLFVFLGWLAVEAAMLHSSYQDTTQNLALPVVYYWAVFILGLALTVVACLWRSAVALRRLGAGGRA